MNNKKRIVFIVNPISGTHAKQDILRLIPERLNQTLYEYVILHTEYAGHASELARQAARNGADTVVAIGGDGTVNEVGRALVHTETALGIIPCGSGNGLARHFRIPLDPKGAIEVLNQGHFIRMDYGKINECLFFCTCGVGFDAFVSLKFANSGKRGLLTYLENALQESITYQPETYEIENETGTMNCKAFLIACANASQYGNNAYIAPQASLTDGMMDIIILKPFTVLDVPALSFQLFNKTINQNSRIRSFREKKIIIRRKNEGVFHFDGDPAIGGKELKVEIIPQGLKVRIPNQEKSNEETFNLLHFLTDLVDHRPLANTFIQKRKVFIEHRKALTPKELKILNQKILKRFTRKE